MKKFIVLMVAIGIIAMASALGGIAMAADNATVNVTATVVGTCKFVSGGTLNIGELPFDVDGTSAGKSYGDVQDLTIKYWCTKGVNYNLSDPVGSFKGVTVERDRELIKGTEKIAYKLKLMDAGRPIDSLRTVQTDITIDAMVAAGTYTDYTPGTYTDNVTLTINP